MFIKYNYHRVWEEQVRLPRENKCSALIHGPKIKLGAENVSEPISNNFKSFFNECGLAMSSTVIIT